MRLPRLGRFPVLRGLPPAVGRLDRKTILFDSWHGTFSDSPRALSEELHRRGSGHNHVWVIGPGLEAPEWATAVAPYSRRYLGYLGRAGYVVTNTGMPSYYRKKPGAKYLQTWHGTPLKRIAFDIEGQGFANRPGYMRDLARDVLRWDALISPNPFSSEILSRAFRYEGRVLETGYPRNDLLSDPRRNEIRERVRRELGIPPGSPAVLYVPTWRDSSDFSLELDTKEFVERLDDHFLLLRLHQLVTSHLDLAPHPRIRDVSAHTDNRELFLAADVLITDYSSVMFDFAVTGKPMLFHTYDLQTYRDDLRGFYFDFENEAPGPLLSKTDALIDALQNLDDVTSRYAPAYAAFRERFCNLEDGRASERVIEAFFD